MGLFDKVFGGARTEQQQDVLNPPEAFAAIVLVAVASDGYLSDEESTGIYTTLSRMQMFKNYSTDVVRRMFDKLLGIMRRDGAGSLVDLAIASLPFELKETVFAVATDLVLADGHVAEEEKKFLNDLQIALGLNDAIAIKIIEVLLIKNRG